MAVSVTKSGQLRSSNDKVSRRSRLGVLLLSVALSCSAPVVAMEELAEDDLRGATGEGIALALDSFSFRMAPTSYIEMTGSAVIDTASATDAYSRGWRRGDLRWYGLSMTGGESADGVDWYSPTGAAGAGTCAPGSDGLGCPMGRAAVKDFASVYNPYLIRVFQYAGYNYQGNCLGTVVSGACSAVTAASPTVYEFIGPSKGDAWRWSFWGQLDVAQGGAVGDQGYLQSQTIIRGKNSTLDGKSTKLQLLQTPTTVVAEQSLSLVYESRLSGDFRFSVGQKAVGTEARNNVPDFNDSEGMYFKNVDAFLPLGQLNYQTMVFRSDTSVLDGDFILELTPIPNISNIYNSFYCGTNTCTTSTFTSPGAGAIGAISYSYDQIASPSSSTHGYVRWGLTTGAAPTEGSTTDTTNGIYFKDNAGAITNIGRARVDGMLIQAMKMTSLGAGT